MGNRSEAWQAVSVTEQTLSIVTQRCFDRTVGNGGTAGIDEVLHSAGSAGSRSGSPAMGRGCSVAAGHPESVAFCRAPKLALQERVAFGGGGWFDRPTKSGGGDDFSALGMEPRRPSVAG